MDALRHLIVGDGQDLWRIRKALQEAFLEGLYRQADATHALSFIGGTALRLFFGLPRFSEDLDFALEGQTGGLKHLVGVALENIRPIWEPEIRVRRHSGPIFQARLIFRGLLYELGLSPLKDETLMIRVEINQSPFPGARTCYRRLGNVNVRCHDPGSLMAGKIGALIFRRRLKARDVFDLAWMIHQGWTPNPVMLQERFRREGVGESPRRWPVMVRARLAVTAWSDIVQEIDRFLPGPLPSWFRPEIFETL